MPQQWKSFLPEATPYAFRTPFLKEKQAYLGWDVGAGWDGRVVGGLVLVLLRKTVVLYLESVTADLLSPSEKPTTNTAKAETRNKV